MDISSLSSNPTIQQAQGVSAATNVAHRDSDSDNDGSRVQGGRGQFFHAVMQALQQNGISLPSPGNSDNSSSGDSSSNNNDAVKQALHNFMHTLFQAMHKGGQGANTATASSQADSDGDNDGSRPGETEGNEGSSRALNDAQKLLQSMGTPNSNDTALQSSFQSLVQALGGSSSSATLQGVMQSLVQDLGGVAPQSSGNLHSSQA